MAPRSVVEISGSSLHNLAHRRNAPDGDWRSNASSEALVLESWSEGFYLGGLVIMICITIANLRRGVVLHKLILIELSLATLHGTFCLMDYHGYGWYLSSTAALLYCSYVLHNFVAWLKVKPFFNTHQGSYFGPRICRWVPRIYLGTLCMSIPPVILQIYNNFRYFNNLGLLYKAVRPYEPLLRDPWWVWTNIVLLHIIRKSYGIGVVTLIRRSPRLGILLVAVCFALVFTTVDFCTSVVPQMTLTDGINPYWKLSLVFKCLTDTIMLDDFKTELTKISSTRGQPVGNQVETSPTFKRISLKGGFYEVEHVESTNPAYMATLREWPPTNEHDKFTAATPLPQSKSALGKAGHKISPLPSLDHDIYFSKSS